MELGIAKEYARMPTGSPQFLVSYDVYRFTLHSLHTVINHHMVSRFRMP